MTKIFPALALTALLNSPVFADPMPFCEYCGPLAPTCDALINTDSPSKLNLREAITREESCRSAGKAHHDISAKIVLYAQNKYLLIQYDNDISNLKKQIKDSGKIIKQLKKDIKKAKGEEKTILEQSLVAVEAKKEADKTKKDKAEIKKGYTKDASEKLKVNIILAIPEAKPEKLDCVGPEKRIVACP